MKHLKIVICFVFWSVLASFAWEDSHSPNYTRVSIPLTEESEEMAKRFAAPGEVGSICSPNLYSADLNEDGKKDYIFERFFGGCGLAACISELHFYLSCPKGYMKTVFTVYCFDKKDIIRHMDKNYFVLTVETGWKSHSYWLNRIYSFGKDGLMREADDEIGAPFPSCIQYLYREIHDQANLPEAEKTQMWIEAKKKVFAQYDE